ncbi:protein ImuB [Albidovulum inexpectatum]|uniref:Protein ImuB n=1 Tax=Albidovulum inexpectatum TaxID=196587 RepID=A0A2S5JLK8_9RHOB|nr:DNA polymerase Y family protein [Albidovulum inexpectatum]PPB82303.1 protein ImuB [Albidovulum inexpectatum]
MRNRRILSLWFPRLGAERLLRQMRTLPPEAFAIVGEQAGRQTLTSLSVGAESRGLYRGQPLAEARAICPELVTRPQNLQAERAFLAALRRWAGRFSPWIGEEPPDSLIVDLTGAAHLFGGEDGVLQTVETDCARLGLTVRAAIADTVGAAWALARHADMPAPTGRNGDSIDQEARATRSRAARRHWLKGGAPPLPAARAITSSRIAAPGQTRQALAPLPLAALRLPPNIVDGLARLGLRHVGDLLGMARAPLARRFGPALIRRLDQALGLEPEPISPARQPLHFAVRLTFPDPIGLPEDITAGLDRLLPALCRRLQDQGHGARRLRLQLFRTDRSVQELTFGLARPSADPMLMRSVLNVRIASIAPGFGIDVMRLEAAETEPYQPRQHRGPLAGTDGPAPAAQAEAMSLLISRLGARIGMEAITRLAPADSHIPEKSALILPAAWSEPADHWPHPHAPRPAVLFRPEPVQAADIPGVPRQFRWRRQDLVTASATGPERIAPEWWLDDPEWRSGTRDYWRVETTSGIRLWLFFAHGADIAGGWFCHGVFA